jgi:hypothetical protein
MHCVCGGKILDLVKERFGTRNGTGVNLRCALLWPEAIERALHAHAQCQTWCACRRAVVRQETIEQDHFRRGVLYLAALRIVRRCSGRNQKPKHQTGHRADDAQAQLERLTRFIFDVLVRQRAMEQYPKERPAEEARKDDETDDECAQRYFSDVIVKVCVLRL